MDRGDPAGLPGDAVAKINAILSFLEAAPGIDAPRSVPTWRVHALTGGRKGTWSLAVTRNWRITFRIDERGVINDLDYEDYH